MSDGIDKLKSQHTSLIDRQNGYEQALEDAEGKARTPLSAQRDNLKRRIVEMTVKSDG
jgi:hypothetical protein